MFRLITLIIVLMGSLANAAPIKIEGPDPVRSTSNGNDGEWIQSDSLLGNVVVITVVSRYMEKESYFVNWKLATRLRDGDFRMITVIDFMGIAPPGILYNYAQKRILKETTATNNDLQKRGVAPIKYICDVKEVLRNKLGADPRHRVDIIILDKTGEVQGRFNGAREIEAAIKLIDQLTGR
jgi:hypothetical protein